MNPSMYTMSRLGSLLSLSTSNRSVPPPGGTANVWAKEMRIDREAVRSALSHLVQPEALIDAIGAAVVSADSMLLYGSSGNGKSSIVAALRRMLPGAVAVPYAIDVDGNILRVFDGRVHEPLPPAGGEEGADGATPGVDGRRDRRFELCRRPLVTLSSELRLEHLDVSYSTAERACIAPPQLKANGGVVVIDDLGRQLARPEELMNRWLAPMASGLDQLTLPSGGVFETPFDVILAMATNLDPRELGDEAFLRRIRHKVHVPDPTPAEFLEILRRVCAAAGIDYREEASAVLMREFYEQPGRSLRGAHPGEIVHNLLDFARFRGVQPELTVEPLRTAASAYFVET